MGLLLKGNALRHSFFIIVLLTVTFPTATRIGLGFGGGSCKTTLTICQIYVRSHNTRCHKETGRMFPRLASKNQHNNFSLGYKMSDQWITSLPRCQLSDRRVCTPPSSCSPLCKAPEPPWFARPADRDHTSAGASTEKKKHAFSSLSQLIKS